MNRQASGECDRVRVNYAKLGAKLRIARLRLGLRQADVATAARLSRQTVSRAESGRVGSLTIDALDRLAEVLGVWPNLDVRSPSSDLDRLLNARHAALAEQVVLWIRTQAGWSAMSEVSFAVGREVGAIDVLAYHVPTCQLAVIELKTSIYDVSELLGTLDRKERLAGSIARDRGWVASAVSVWLIVADSSTNRRRVADHRSMITSKLPTDGRSFRASFRHPIAPIRGVAFWSNDFVVGTNRETAARERVRRPNRPGSEADSRSAKPASGTVGSSLRARANRGSGYAR